jgi:outer membrane protein
MRQSVITAAVLCASAGVALAQEGAAAKAVGTPRIAVIDMNRISSETLMGKSYATQIEGLKNEIDSEGTKKQTELAKLDTQIKTLQDDLDKQSTLLSPDGLDKKKSEIVKKQRDRQAFLEDGQAELDRMRERARQQAQAFNAEFQQKIRPTIELVAKEKGIDILLDDQVALWANKAFDITQDVIVRADDAERAGRAKSGSAAPTGAKPAAGPAKPAPSPSPKP